MGGHQTRGIGRYAKLLLEALNDSGEIELTNSNRLAQVIHYPYFDFFFPTLPLPWPKPSVVTLHDTIPLVFRQHYPVGRRGQLNFLRQKTYLKMVRAIITDSQSSANDIQTYLGINSTKIRVVHLAADPVFQPVSSTKITKVARKYNLPKSYILYVGDINYNKNLPALIKAIKYLPKTLKLVLVGKNFVRQSIPEWQAIETQIALSDVQSRVKLLNNVSPDAVDDLNAIYSGATVYVQPSLYEGFGLPILEAMQSGCPVVASNNSSLPEVAGDAALLVEPDAESLAAGIQQVLDLSPSARQKMIKQGIERAKTFTWKKTARGTIEVYKSLI